MKEYARTVVPLRLGVIAELVVTQRQIVETFAATLGRDAEDLGKQADAELLVVAGIGFYETL